MLKSPYKDEDSKCSYMYNHTLLFTDGMSYDLIIIWCFILVDWLTKWPNIGMILQ